MFKVRKIFPYIFIVYQSDFTSPVPHKSDFGEFKTEGSSVKVQQSEISLWSALAFCKGNLIRKKTKHNFCLEKTVFLATNNFEAFLKRSSLWRNKLAVQGFRLNF